MSDCLAFSDLEEFILAPEQTAGHLKLCREVYAQLRRIQVHQGHNGSRVANDLPFNLSVFLGHFAGYIKWAREKYKSG